MKRNNFRLSLASSWRLPKGEEAIDWIPRWIVMPSDTETPGPFDLGIFPHCDDPLIALNDPMVRVILLPWASRLGKTIFGLSALIYFAINMPRPMMLGRENEDAINDLVDSQFYPLLESCNATRKTLLPNHKRNRRNVQIDRCRVRRSFGGSPTTLTGFPACYALASEVSKWPTRKSREANPIYLFLKRGFLFPFDSKYILESTPSLKDDCTITSLVSAPGVDIRERYCPCPKCGEYQKLVYGNGEDNTPGIKYEKNRHGRSDPMIAENNSWYECVNGCKIENQDRPELLRKGVWLSRDHQKINNQGKIKGKRPMASTVSFGDPVDAPFSSLYSLAISGWGQIAAEFISGKHDAERLREFVNQTLGRVWDPSPPIVEPHDLGARLCGDYASNTVPEWAKFLTAGIDVQDYASIFKYIVCAWGSGGRVAEIDHGEFDSWDDLDREILNGSWNHADGGTPMQLSLSLIDSGHETEQVYHLARKSRRLLACKGMNKPFGLEYKLVTLAPENRRNKQAVGTVYLVEINTDWTQRWIQKHLEGKANPFGDSLEIATDSTNDIPFLEELLNERRVEDVDSRGYPTVSWMRICSHTPNDFRDTFRYARVAGSIVVKGNWNNLPVRKPGNQPKKETKNQDSESSGFVRKPKGRFIRRR